MISSLTLCEADVTVYAVYINTITTTNNDDELIKTIHEMKHTVN